MMTADVAHVGTVVLVRMVLELGGAGVMMAMLVNGVN